jgi:hypothetical protein
MSFTLANVFSGAFSSVVKGFVPLLVFTLLLYLLPTQAITLGLRYGMDVPFGTLQAFEGNMLYVSIGAALVMYFMTFMHVSAIYEVCVLVTAGKPVKLGEVFVHALGNAIPIFAIYLLCAIGWIIGSVLLLVPAFIFGVFFSVVIPAYVTEKPGIFGAFSRSQALTKGHRWGIFGLWVLVLVIVYVIILSIEMPFLMPMIMANMQAAANGQQAGTPPVLPLGVTIAVAVVGSLVFVVILAINASVYSCLRAEKDRLSSGTVEKIFE